MASAPVSATFWRWPANNAILVADAHNLILASGMPEGFSGLALTADKDWQRLQSVLAIIVDKVYAD